MMRRSPMKRSAQSVARPERQPVSVTPLTRTPNYARTSVPLPVRKREYVRSKTLREAYRLIPCQHCGIEDGTVCCAHSNWAEHGKGKSIKACDTRGASLCVVCHLTLDQGASMDRPERRAMWWAAHVKSVTLLVQLGHWPRDIEAPETKTNPFQVGAQES